MVHDSECRPDQLRKRARVIFFFNFMKDCFSEKKNRLTAVIRPAAHSAAPIHPDGNFLIAEKKRYRQMNPLSMVSCQCLWAQ